MTDLEKARQVLKDYWGFDTFRPNQEDVINAVLEGEDCIALLPTGAGKSICFQVPAVVLDGICIVISPLIALMKDQVERLKNLGIQAEALHTGLRKTDIDRTLDNCIYGKVKLLYISPERLHSPLAQERIKRMPVSFIAVDEAHCISQWGFDFRPSYTKIPLLREWHPRVPILAVTATATPTVVSDIETQLQLRNAENVTASFRRTNLRLNVLKTDDKHGRLVRAVRAAEGTSIVYVRSRRRTKEVARLLGLHKIKSEAYHAGMPHEDRIRVQERWLNGTTPVIVCTTAFGMGIDKPNVRLVAHYDLPGSLEEYYQEAGRAGRDGEMSECVLVYNTPDQKATADSIIKGHPTPDNVKTVYRRLVSWLHLPVDSDEPVSYPFVLRDFCVKYGLNMYSTYKALEVLQREGWIILSDSVYRQARLQFVVGKQKLFKLDPDDKLREVFTNILRMHEGVFIEPVSINERSIAERSEITRDYLRSLLNKAHKEELVHYLPESDEPLITFIYPRVEAYNLKIDTQHIIEMRARAQERLNSVLKFIATDTCRERVLLAYFGEDIQVDCGRCDLCRSRMGPPTYMDVLRIVDEVGRSLRSFLDAFDTAHEQAVREHLAVMEADRIIEVRDGLIKRRRS